MYKLLFECNLLEMKMKMKCKIFQWRRNVGSREGGG